MIIKIKIKGHYILVNNPTVTTNFTLIPSKNPYTTHPDHGLLEVLKEGDFIIGIQLDNLSRLIVIRAGEEHLVGWQEPLPWQEVDVVLVVKGCRGG